MVRREFTQLPLSIQFFPHELCHNNRWASPISLASLWSCSFPMLALRRLFALIVFPAYCDWLVISGHPTCGTFIVIFFFQFVLMLVSILSAFFGLILALFRVRLLLRCLRPSISGGVFDRVGVMAIVPAVAVKLMAAHEAGPTRTLGRLGGLG